MELLSTRSIDTPVGPVLAVASESGLCALYLDGEHAGPRLDAWRRRYAPVSQVEACSQKPLIDIAQQQLEAYFQGQRRSFDLPLDRRGTDFQREVWSELRRIPFGQTASYGELGRRLGRPGASRAVGAANGANPIPIVVPCHRVVAAKGLGGFSGGLERKLALLRHEGVLLPG